LQRFFVEDQCPAELALDFPNACLFCETKKRLKRVPTEVCEESGKIVAVGVKRYFQDRTKIKLSRFSLRILIVSRAFWGVTLAWLAHQYREYRAE